MTLDGGLPLFDLDMNVLFHNGSEAKFSRTELSNGKTLASDSATVFLIDPDPAAQTHVATVAESLRRRIEVFSSAEAFRDGFSPDRPGCIVSELRLPGGSGLDLLNAIRSAGAKTPLLFVTSCKHVASAVEAIRAGALDVVEKPVSENALAESIEQAIQQDAQIRFRQSQEKRLADRLAHLTRRERQVMHLVIEGLTNKQVAAQLDVSVKTIEAHRAHLMRKMNAANLPQLIHMSTSLMRPMSHPIPL